MAIVALSDFVDGKYNLPGASSSISSTNSELQAYIDRYEPKYIYKLLGIELGKLIIAYGGSGNPDYDKIIGEFTEVEHGESLGLKEYLLACIYYEYKTGTIYNESLAGTVKADAEVSTQVNASTITRAAEKVFNSILDTADAIQSLCQSDSTAYAGYSGTPLSVKGHQFFI